ncbi:FAD-dependent monooxygenase [Curtobacterium herbarum]|uniref:FAD-dependent monooxygenase n=1 Tax=Curtobacterium herbarum TaxID=150122 RepID=A0ABP4K2H6_9MICO|nr:FAD-dependent monooxygenase [Curtobacterium herbarum]MBM7473862.1 2-polyprenyl-6-methoxyphenol hydroxylase-like FAD-dependent oxidoreductase [Curtobacterium herbarum]MCS6544809.1 FAD-dependent monooxygenase [Curtobacterium herbarum]
MQNRTAVVSGASIAGLSTAYWLRRTGWDVTVIERAPAFRDGGQNVDVRGVARDVLRRMGLFDAVKAANTTETGTVLVDGRGVVTAELPSDGAGGATAELEILRGDLARTVLDALPAGVTFVYGDSVSAVDDDADGVTLTTEAGRRLRADLFVIAEGVRSRTRATVFGEDVVDQRDLDVTMVFGTIPRTDRDDDRWRWHNAVRGRQVHLRPDPYGTIRAILAYSPGDDVIGLSREETLAVVRRRYDGVGWEAPRILDALDTSPDVYIDQLQQVRMSTWHRGHVVMAGDAGWCVTPMGGGGASLALTAGYVLAAQLADPTQDQEAALAAYESWMRPLVDDVQDLPRGLMAFAYPQSRLALALRGVVDRVLTSKPLRPLAAKLTQVAETDRELPVLVGR